MKVAPQTRLTSLLWIFRVIVYCLKIIGLAPFSVGTTTSTINFRQACIINCRFSRIGFAYNLLLSILFSFGSIFLLQYRLSQNIGEITVPVIVVIIRFINAAFSSAVVLIFWTFRQRKVASILNRLLEVEYEFSGLKKRPSERKTIIFLTLHIIINTFVWVTFWITIPVPLLEPYESWYWIFKLTTCYISYWFTVEYFIVVGFLARGLETINTNLLNLKDSCCYPSHPPFVNVSSPSFSTQTQTSRLSALRSLIRIREKLFDVSQDVEDFFSFPIVWCIGCSFFALVCETFRFIIRFDTSPDASLIFIMWIFLHLYPTVALSANVTETGKQAKLTSLIVSQVLATPLERKIRRELEQFSVQLIHDDFIFTGYDLFTLDFTMVHSILGATTTYLVILLQF